VETTQVGTTERIAKNMLFNFMGSGIDISLAMIQSIVLARMLGVDEYGSYSFYAWAITLAGFIVNLGWGVMAQRFIAEAIGQDDRKKATGLIRLAIVGRILPSLLATLVIIGISPQLAHFFVHGKQPIYFIIVACTILPFTMTQMFISVCKGFQKFRYNMYFVLATTPLRVVTQISLAMLGFGVLTMLGVNLFSLVIGLAVSVLLLNRLVPLRQLISSAKLDTQTRASAVRFALPVAVLTGISYILWEKSEIIFLGHYSPSHEVGFYNLAGQIPRLGMEIIPMVFAALLLPAISEAFGENDLSKVKSIYLTSARYLMLISLPMAVMIVALAGPIVNLLYGAQYEPVIGLMRILCFPRAVYALLSVGSAVILALNKPVFALKAGALLAALCIGLNFFLVPRFGAMGAAIGTSIAQVLMLPIYIWFVGKTIKVLWPFGDGLRIILASAPAGLVLYLLSNYLGPVEALCVGIPGGVLLVAGGLVLFGAVRQEDINRFDSLDQILPPPFRRTYTTLINIVGRLVQARQALVGRPK
jgi:O-antigen/teichoic acid export membrane protein